MKPAYTATRGKCCVPLGFQPPPAVENTGRLGNGLEIRDGATNTKPHSIQRTSCPTKMRRHTRPQDARVHSYYSSRDSTRQDGGCRQNGTQRTRHQEVRNRSLSSSRAGVRQRFMSIARCISHERFPVNSSQSSNATRRSALPYRRALYMWEYIP